MQHINNPNALGLETDMGASLVKTLANLAKEWHNDEKLAHLPFSEIRINPLIAEQHPTTIRGITVVQISEVAVGKVQLISVTPF